MIMQALIDNVTGECAIITADASSYDTNGYTVVDAPDDPENWAWDVATQTFVTRPPRASEETDAALEGDPRWQALKTASPQQIENWLANNVTNLTEAREVLKILLLGLQKVAKTRLGI